MPNTYTSTDNSKYSNFEMCKTQRGFGSVYDSVLETYVQLNGSLPESLLEIGIGNAGSHIDWSCVLLNSKIYGLDNCRFSVNPSSDEQAANSTVIGQWANNIQGIDKFFSLPISLQKRIILHWNRNGYEIDTVQEFVETYGKMDIVVNDGKQDGLVHNLLLDAWKDNINPKGAIVQDKIGRAGGTGCVRGKQINKAISKGWAVYDCRHLTQMNTDAVENGFIAVYGSPEYSDNLDKVANRVHDINELLSSNYLTDEE